MILVTIGTTDFNALIETMDKLSQELAEKMVMQIGRSRYVPEHCEFFRFAPSLDPYYESASLVISHGGLGIVTEVLNRRLPLVAVEDPDQPDRHQREILAVWDQGGHLIWCRNLRDLPQAIAQARTQQFKPYVLPECRIPERIADFLNRRR
jgi:UDP-N-acetylglucosamine transferase subunit ALG13